MRIISGTARGRKLTAPEGEDTRPTADRIREALFNILGTRVAGAEVLDLFGGTGAMALEALSRGADRAVIVDSDVRAQKAIMANARAVLKDELDERFRLLPVDYRKALENLGGDRFDLVFIDPPYRYLDFYPDALERLQRTGLLREHAVMVLEHRRGLEITVPQGFDRADVRHYGKTTVELVVEADR